jgi:hypothetical protein
MHHMDFDSRLEIPGVDADTQVRLAALVLKLTKVVDKFGKEEWRHNANTPFQSLYRAQQSAETEEQYLQNLLKEADPNERMKRVCYRLKSRAEVVASALWLHEDYLTTRQAVQGLAAELKRLQELLPSQSAGDNRLAAFCIGLAGLIRNWKRDFDARDELLKVKGVEMHHLLEAVNVLFDVAKSGTALRPSGSWDAGPAPAGASPFSRYDLDLHLIRTAGAAPEHAELIAAVVAVDQARREFEHRRHRYHDAKSRLNRPQFAERLEAVMLPKELQPEWVARWDHTFDTIKQQQMDAEATYFAECSALTDWYPVFQAARQRLVDALAASLALLDPKRDHYNQTRMFDTEAGIATYKAIINCIHARHVLDELDELDASSRKAVAQMTTDFRVDTPAYIAAAIELGSQPIPAIVPTPQPKHH